MNPNVVIVGRPNVGKSSLLNLIAQRRISIVDPTAGVTRDRVSTTVTLTAPAGEYRAQQIELIDTGGYGIQDSQNLTAEVEQQIAYAIHQAHLILFIIDAQTGIVPLDREVARLLHSSDTKTPVLIIANKVDGPTHIAAAQEAACLGFGPPLMASATSSYNKAALTETICRQLEANPPPHDVAGADDDPAFLLAIAGKRNAGKSTLVNALAGQERVIVSEIEGTTRDSIDVRFEMNDKVFIAIDTAGVRKTKSLSGDIEYYSYHRTLRSVRRADVVLLLIDAAVPISQVDQQLAAEILKHHKPCVIVLNKWDLAQKDYTQDQYMEYLDGALKGLSFAPVVFTSAKHNEGLREVIAMAVNLYQQAGHRVSTGELNRVMEKIMAQKTPSSKIGRRPKIYYTTQLDVHPPTVGLFVNDHQMFEPTYQRFIINRFRELLPYAEVPIKLLIRGKKTIPAEARLAAQHSGRSRIFSRP